MIYGSVCSGIEAASLAWEPLGWNPAWFAEIEPFPSAVLAHHWPHVTNLGDMTKIATAVLRGDVVAPDILVGGTPCQAFSVAGAREGLADDRGFLTIKYVELANAIDQKRAAAGAVPCITVWENVPGVLSSKDNAFGAFLGFLAGEDCELVPPGKKWENAGCVLGPQRAIAWRILDAQYFGVAQRRRRVFVVASAREGFDPAKVLFEYEGLRRDTPPSREAREETAGTLASRTGAGGFPGTDEACSGYLQPVAFGGGNTRGSIDVAARLTAKGQRIDFEVETFAVQCVTGDITHTLKAEGFDASEDGTGRGQPIVPVAYPLLEIGKRTGTSTTDPRAGIGIGNDNDPMFTLQASAQHGVAYSVSLRGREGGATAELGGEVAGCLRASSGGGDKPHVLAQCATGDITHTLKAEGFDASADGTGRGQPIAPVSYGIRTANTSSNGWGIQEEVTHTLDTAQGIAVSHHMAVRRLTPVECERLQGFPDGWTSVPYRGKPASDGPRYKAIGNSMAVPCMAFIGLRIDLHLSEIDLPAVDEEAA